MGAEQSQQHMSGGYVPGLPSELNHHISQFLDTQGHARAAATSRSAREYPRTLQHALNSPIQQTCKYIDDHADELDDRTLEKVFEHLYARRIYWWICQYEGQNESLSEKYEAWANDKVRQEFSSKSFDELSSPQMYLDSKPFRNSHAHLGLLLERFAEKGRCLYDFYTMWHNLMYDFVRKAEETDDEEYTEAAFKILYDLGVRSAPGTASLRFADLFERYIAARGRFGTNQ